MMTGEKEKEKRTCKYLILHARKSCGRDLYDDEHCIFHSKGIERKQEKFDEEFSKEFERQKKQEEKYNFTGFVFPGDISFIFKEFEKDVYFDEAEFSGHADFREAQFYKNASFLKTKFSEKSDFMKTKFTGNSYFIETEFSKWAHIREVQFSKDAYFGKANFSGNAEFLETEFYGRADFSKTQFIGGVDFWRGRFYGEADFRSSQFYENVNFIDAKFDGKADFLAAQFSGETHFRGAQVYGEANFFKAQFSGKVSFMSVQFYSGVDFMEAKFSEETEFRYVQFFGWADFLYSKFSGGNLQGLFEALRNRGLQRIFKGKYKIKDFRFHLSEPIAKEYPIIDRMTKDAWYLDDFKNNHPFIHALWNVMAKCGQSIGRWALWSLFFALYFAFNYYLINYAFPHAFFFNPAIQDKSLWSFIYYSIVTFTTLGFGDIIPTLSWVQRWVMAEVIGGYIMLGGLVSILANKLARRS